MGTEHLTLGGACQQGKTYLPGEGRGQGRPVLRVREHPQLLTSDAGSDTELRHTSRALFRPPWRLQAHAAVRDRLRPHAVLSSDG